MSRYMKHSGLPKANLITLRASNHKWWCHTVRIANAREFFLFRFVWFTVRRPWLKGSAKALHPELFDNREVRDASK
ncbi:Uncharacterised protein [Serratia entomophila]|nr:Uncharacterised protein [Serratia entomophila]